MTAEGRLAMMTPEETRLLRYLQKHPFSTLAEIVENCLPGASPEWSKRVVANLEWLNNVTVFYDRAGDPVALELTEKGMALARTVRAS